MGNCGGSQKELSLENYMQSKDDYFIYTHRISSHDKESR